jgi:DNA invertase Pin-like site-specific DNA recombinase
MPTVSLQKLKHLRPVVEATAKEFGMSPELLYKPTSKREIVAVRYLAMQRLVELGVPVATIARHFGCHYDTVRYAIGRKDNARKRRS